MSIFRRFNQRKTFSAKVFAIDEDNILVGKGLPAGFTFNLKSRCFFIQRIPIVSHNRYYLFTGSLLLVGGDRPVTPTSRRIDLSRRKFITAKLKNGLKSIAFYNTHIKPQKTFSFT
jgi:hypothetical protein